MKCVIHVHQQKMRKGEAAIIVRTYKGSTHYREVRLNGPWRIIQRDEPDRCGARIVIETDTKYIELDSLGEQNVVR